jgi:hypothetical protein
MARAKGMMHSALETEHKAIRLYLETGLSADTIKNKPDTLPGEVSG